jgi:hypothetical protein
MNKAKNIYHGITFLLNAQELTAVHCRKSQSLSLIVSDDIVNTLHPLTGEFDRLGFEVNAA